jgi:hypothetical protein
MVQSVRAQAADRVAARFDFGADAMRVLLAATVQSGANQFPVRLRNVASKAALVESEVIPKEGSIVQLSRGAVCISARVSWAGAASFELEFRETVDERALLVRLSGSPPAKAQYPIEYPVGRAASHVIPISKQ